MQAPREIELKLECDPPDLTALAAHPLLQAPGPAEAIVMRTAYHDTQDHDLRSAHLALRVRSSGGSHVQTLKAAAAGAGLFDRPEWEWSLPGEAPDAALLDGTPAADILAGAKDPTLRALFRTIVERSERRIRYGGSEIAATLDAGRVETEDGDAPLCELELELKQGSPTDLFALAQALGQSVPLRLGALSKGERGHALIEGSLRKPSKAPAIRYDEGVTAGEAFTRIAGSCLRHLRLNEAVFLQARDPEALHQMRVALRRLRSAFTLFKPMLAGDARAQALRDEIKRVTEPFGQARNLDVFLAETLAQEIERRPDEPGLYDLRDRLTADRAHAYEAVLAVLQSRDWRTLLIDLVTWIEAGPWRGDVRPHRDRPATDFASEVLERLRRRIKTRGRHLDAISPEERHRLRIEAKKLRYGAEFFGPLFDRKKARKRHKRFVAALSDLQDHLGALNDLATAHTIAADLTGADPAGAERASGAALFAAGLTAADAEARAGGLVEAAADAQEDLIEVRRFWV